MRPPDQSLDAQHSPGPQVELGLVDRRDTAAAQRLVQVAHQRQPLPAGHLISRVVAGVRHQVAGRPAAGQLGATEQDGAVGIVLRQQQAAEHGVQGQS